MSISSRQLLHTNLYGNIACLLSYERFQYLVPFWGIARERKTGIISIQLCMQTVVFEPLTSGHGVDKRFWKNGQYVCSSRLNKQALCVDLYVKAASRT